MVDELTSGGLLGEAHEAPLGLKRAYRKLVSRPHKESEEEVQSDDPSDLHWQVNSVWGWASSPRWPAGAQGWNQAYYAGMTNIPETNGREMLNYSLNSCLNINTSIFI